PSGADVAVAPVPPPAAPEPPTAAAAEPAPAPVADPVVAAPVAEPVHQSAAAPDKWVDDIYGRSAAEPEESYAPPARPRRNKLKLWTYAAVAFFLAIGAAGGALWYFGTPSWAVNLG